jgi:hypothetical protein
MLVLFLACLLTAANGGGQDQTKSTNTDSTTKKTTKKQNESEADKIADKILAETTDPLLATKWYEEIFPALKRKYKKTVSRETYDAWRFAYFDNEVRPKVTEAGISGEEARQAFKKLTERQPSE